MASVEERLKLKRGQVEPWTTREKLCLASCVVRSGNQNWMSVSRSLRAFGGEPGRPGDWFSQKSCAVQYDSLLTQIETPKRKKRGADGSKNEGPDLTPAEVIVKQLTSERIEELRKCMAEAHAIYMKEKEEVGLVQNGLADDRLEQMILKIEEEKKLKEEKQEEHQRWLKKREERKQEMELAARPHTANQHFRGPVPQSVRRLSNQSELSSEVDNAESLSNSEAPAPTEDHAETKPASTPTSPLLTSLLKSPSPITGTQSSSVRHSVITSQRSASPTITSMLNSSPGVPNSTAESPSRKYLVSNSLAGQDDSSKMPSHSSSSSPTLSKLLELPPSTPGRPGAVKQPAITSAQPTTSKTAFMASMVSTGVGLEKLTVEHLLDVDVSKSHGQCQPPVALDIWEEASTIPSEDNDQNYLENSTAIELNPSEAPIQVTSGETHLPGDLPVETPAAHDNHVPQTVIVSAYSEASPGKDLDSVKKDLLPDIAKVSVVLPVETVNKEPEADTKASLDSADLQQLSSADLEYIVDLQECVPEGLVLEMPDEYFGEDVTNSNLEDTSVSHEVNLSEQVTTKPETDESKIADNIPESKHVKEESDSASFVIHTTPPTHQSPLRVSATVSSTSPRSVGRPPKGNMVARKIVMEDEELQKSEAMENIIENHQPERDSHTISREALENASIVIMQDNGEFVKLSESGQESELMNDIHVIQDSSNNSVVLLPQEDVTNSKSNASNQVIQTSLEENLDTEKVVEKEGSLSPKKDVQPRESKSPKRVPSKSNDMEDLELVAGKNTDGNADDSFEVSEKRSTIHPPNQVVDDESSRSSDVSPSELKSQEKETKVDDLQECENLKDFEPLSLKKREELSPRKYKSPSLKKREMSPVVNDRSNEKMLEDDSSKVKALNDHKGDLDINLEESATISRETAQKKVTDDTAQNADIDAHVVQIKEEKAVRAETPSTEDDNTRDTEPVSIFKPRRGRYGRESTANADSVPNSPTPTNISSDDEKEHRMWKKSIMLVHQRISAHKNASIFQKPITDDKAPGYSSMVFRPLDLQAIKKNIENGVIRTTNEFQRDIFLMFYNAIMYNKSNSIIYQQTAEMQEECAKHLEEYVNTQNRVAQAPSRRGTRTTEKKDQDSDGFTTRRGLSDRSAFLGKRKRSLPEDKITPKRRRDDD